MRVLEIRSTPARLAIEVSRAKLAIERSYPKLTIKRTPPAMKTNATDPTFKINQAVMPLTGNMHSSDMMAREARRSLDIAAEFTSRLSEEGDAMMKIENKQNPIPQIALQRQEQGYKEINIGLNPQSANSIEWTDTSLGVDWSPHSLEISWDTSTSPKITVTPHSVKIYMKQWPKVEISVVEQETYEPQVDTVL